jgi:FixJ family two-component response regulator
MKAGAVESFTKPFSDDALWSVIPHAVDRSHTHFVTRRRYACSGTATCH